MHTDEVDVWLYSFLTLTLDRGEWLAIAPLPPVQETPVRLNRRLVRPLCWSGLLETSKISVPFQDANPGSSSLQLGHYTDHTILAHMPCVQNIMYPTGLFHAHCHSAQRLGIVSDVTDR
jgi:hypothetical protein